MSKAHTIANKAEKDGILVNPGECEKCFANKPLVKHHTDYDKPLEITWLCRSCHKKEHHANPDIRTPGPIGAIIAIKGTDEERQAMWQLRKAAEKDSSLSWSDFILQHFGIRKVEDSKQS